MECTLSAQIVAKLKSGEGVEILSDKEGETTECAAATHQTVTDLK